MSFNAIRENKILAKMFGFTVAKNKSGDHTVQMYSYIKPLLFI